MKKLIMPLIGVVLFVAGYQLTRRHTQYVTAQSALTNGTTYVATPAPVSANLKNSVAFRLIKPS